VISNLLNGEEHVELSAQHLHRSYQANEVDYLGLDLQGNETLPKVVLIVEEIMWRPGIILTEGLSPSPTGGDPT
jgi:hypothetical protein